VKTVAQPRRDDQFGSSLVGLDGGVGLKSIQTQSEVALLLPDVPVVAYGLEHDFRGVVQPSRFLFI
jgi:hypothetical protein